MNFQIIFQTQIYPKYQYKMDLNFMLQAIIQYLFNKLKSQIDFNIYFFIEIKLKSKITPNPTLFLLFIY